MKTTLKLNSIPMKIMRTHPVRTMILMLLVIAQAACVMGGLMLTRSMRQEMALAEARLGADILVYPSAAMSKISSKTLLMQGSPVEVWKDRSILLRMDDCDGIAAVSYQLYIRDSTAETPLWIAGYDPETDFVIAPWIEGQTDYKLPDGSVLAGCRAAQGENAISLFGKSWPVAARLAETGSELDEMVFVNPHTMSALIEAAGDAGITAYRNVDPERDFTVALVQVNAHSSLDSVTSWLNTYIRKVKAVRSEETLTDTSAGMRRQMTMITVIAAGAWIVLLLALGIAQSMMMKERKKELYVWHAIGASRAVVNRVMLLETFSIYAAGALLGILLCAGLLPVLFGTAAELSALLRFALLTMLLTVLIGCVSTLLSVKRATESMNGQMLLTV